MHSYQGPFMDPCAPGKHALVDDTPEPALLWDGGKAEISSLTLGR